MNERIRELADKIWEEKYWTNPNTDKLLPAQLNRFAELIVRECMSLVSEPGPDMNDTERGILAQIKKHFGVEEDQEDTDSACQLCGEDGGTTCGMPGCQY
jgi:hypothetical protein